MAGRTIIFCATLLAAPCALHAATAVTSADFANSWNSYTTPITVVGESLDSMGNYGIVLSDYLNPFGGPAMNIAGSGPFGTALVMGPYALSFAPGWNNDITANVSNLSIYNATNGAIAFGGNGTGAHDFSVSGIYFYNNSASNAGGAISISSQIQSNANNQYILTGNKFIGNSAASGGAVYMASMNSQYYGATNPFVFSVLDDSGNNSYYISLNKAANGGGIYFLSENAQGNVTNQFTAQGYSYYQNYASNMGGAIYAGVLNGNDLALDEFDITGGIFSQNQAGNGGAVAFDINGGNTTAKINIDGAFYSNFALGGGGAIYNAVGDQYSPYGGTITFDINGAFNANKAVNGGAIYNYIMPGQSNVVTNISGNYTNNYASGNGGAFYNTSGNNYPGTSIANIADGTNFFGNGAIYGGAIYNDGNGIINLNTGPSGISMTNNYASGYAAGSDIYQNSATAVINITGGGILDINGGIAGIGTINQNSGNIFNLGSASNSNGYTGVFNQASGAVFNSMGFMFGGQNNFSGTANIFSAQSSLYFNANMLSNSVMNYESLSTNRVSIGAAANNTSAGIYFKGNNSIIDFYANQTQALYFLQNDIQNGQFNTINFANSDIMFGTTDFTGSTNYNLSDSSIINLAQSSSNYQQYNFTNLTGDTFVALSLKVGNDQGSPLADTINVANGGGTINLGKVYVDDSNGILTGIMRVIYGAPLVFQNGEQQYVATSSGTYIITTLNNQYIQFDSVPASGEGSSDSNTNVGGDGSTTTTTTNPDGSTTTVVTNPDGSTSTIITDQGGGSGATIITDPDGTTTITINPGGDTTVIAPGDSGSVNTPGGSIINVGPSGDGGSSTTTITPGAGGGNTTVTTDPNGGGSSVTNPDGSTAGTTTDPNGGSSTGSLINPNNPPSIVLMLYDVNSLDTAATDAGLSDTVSRSWQIGATETYYNAADLGAMADGTFSVHGTNAGTTTSILSGLNSSDLSTKQSLFDIEVDNTYFTLQDLTIQDAYSSSDGSVLNMNNANSTATLTNLVVQNNSSDGDGGAINIIAGDVISTDIQYVNNQALGNGGAISNSGNITKHGGQFMGNTAGGNGGAIYNDSVGGTTIYAGLGGMNFAGNNAGGNGGAIYNAAGSHLSMASLEGADMILDNNHDSGGARANDIWNEGELDFISTGGTFYIGSGIGGTGTINKYSPVVLELASTGDNSYFTGTFNQYNGIVNVDTKFFGGNSNIQGGILNWDTNAYKEDSAILSVTGGTINIYGYLRLANAADIIGPASTLNLFPTGFYEIAGGSVYLNATDMLVAPDGRYGMSSQSDGYLVIGGSSMFVYSGGYTQTGGVMMVTNLATGYLNRNSPSNGLFGGDIVISNATILARNYTLDYGAGAGAIVPTSGMLAMGDGALFDSIDNELQTHNFAGKFAVISTLGQNAQSMANFAIDLDAQNFISDSFVFASGTAAPGDLVIHGNPSAGQDLNGDDLLPDIYAVNANFNLSQINMLNSPLTKVVPFNIMQSPNYDPSLVFTATDDYINTPTGLYSLVSLGQGDYELVFQSINPQTLRGAVTTSAMMLSQLQINNIMFDHVFLDSTECMMCEYSQWQFQMHQKGVWAKGYGGADKLQFGNGLDRINNDLYGIIAGLDFDSVRLGRHKHWTWLPTIYMAYNGGNQKFNDMEMMQNGAQVGMQNTWSNGNWIGAILTYGGFYNNKTDIGNTNDSINNWFAGAGGKIAYDLRMMSEYTIFQPSLLMSYNYFGNQKWNSNYGNIGMETSHLNGLNVAPSLAIITALTDTLNLSASALYNKNFANDITTELGEIDIPDLKIPAWYLEYGLGVVGSIADTTTLDANVSLRQGDGITGFTGRIGLSHRF